MRRFYSVWFLAIFLVASLLFGCRRADAPSIKSEAVSSEIIENAALTEPQPISTLASKAVEPLPKQVKEWAQTSAKAAHLFAVSPDGIKKTAAAWNEYVYANPRPSPDGSLLLLRAYARSEDGQSDLWSANLMVDQKTGEQRYCKDEPTGSKTMQWVGRSTVACVVASEEKAARDLFFFDQSYRSISSPIAFDPPSDTRIITGLWLEDSSGFLVVTEHPQGFSTGEGFLSGDCFLETVDANGRIISKVTLDGYAAPGNSYRGFGSPIRPLEDGRLLIRLQPLDSPQQTEFRRERWVVAAPGQGILYEIPDCHSILALSEDRLFYLEPSIEENDWTPTAYLCTLGETGITDQRVFPSSDLRATVGEGERTFRVADPAEPLWGEAGAFFGDRLWLYATVQQQPDLISSDYNALFSYDFKTADTPSLVTLLPKQFYLAGCDAAGNALVLGAMPYYRYAQDDYQLYEKSDEASRMQAGTDFWNNRGQLLLAAELPTFDLAGIIDPVSIPNPDRIWQGINRVYAYLFWQNGQSPEQYTLSAELMNQRLALLFGEQGWEQHLKDWQNPDKSYTLTDLSPDPAWTDRPWRCEATLGEIYDSEQTRLWVIDCSRYDPQSDSYQYRQLVLEECDSSSRLISIRE